MEFFEWTSLIQLFADFFSYGVNDTETMQKFLYLEFYIGIILGGAIWLALIVLGGLGLMKMAKKEGKKYTFLAFIPFVNTFYAGYVAGEGRLFGQKMKRAGLYAALIETLGFVCGLFVLFADYLFIPCYTLQTETTAMGLEFTQIVLDGSLVPPQLDWLYNAVYGFGSIGIGWLSLVRYVLLIALVVFNCVVFVALFKKYYPQNYILMTVLCVLLPVRGIVFFALRGRTPVDYNAYMRQRMEAYRRSRQYYGGPYSTYGGPTNGQSTPPPTEEPFSDFGSEKKNGQGGNDSPKDGPFEDF